MIDQPTIAARRAHLSPPSAHALRRRTAALIALIGVLLAMLGSAPPAAADHIQRFVLHSYSQEYPWAKRQHEGFMEELSATRPFGRSASVEYLATKRVAYDGPATFTNTTASFYQTHQERILTLLYTLAALFVASLLASLVIVARKNRHIAAKTRALAEVKDSLTRAQHIARMGNWDWHITENRLYWSEGIYGLFGVEPNTYQASYQAFLHSIHPDDRQHVEAEVAAALAGQRPYDVYHRIVRPDGEIRIVRECAEILRDGEGRPLRMSGTVSDVTEAKTLEAELRRHQDHLEELVQSRTAELEAATQRAEAANRAKTEFLARMSHELRTPLNAIIGYGQIMREDLSETGSTQILDDLDKVHGAANHLLSIINAVLDLSKVEAGRMECFVEEFSVGDLLDETVAIAEPLMKKNGNRLVVVCHYRGLTLHSDRQKLKQILLNLLSNAAKFACNSEVNLTVARDGDHTVALRVADRGIGMSEEALQHLFQPFTQVDGSTRRKFDGTGLGLYLTQKFAEMLGGSVGAESTQGVGSTFTVRLPLFTGATRVAAVS